MADKKKDVNTESEEIKEETEVKEEVKEEKAQETSKQEKEKKENKQDAKIEELTKSVEEYKDKWLRSVAEFDNYKKRNAKMWQDAFSEGAQSIINKVLPIGDSLDWAITMGLDEKTVEGLKNLKKKYDDALISMELTEINPVGEKFDPNIAEAVMQVDGEEGEESETVKMVLQKGYKLKDKIIRYAKVSVIK